MQELEKILEEIESKEFTNMTIRHNMVVKMKDVRSIIRKHMNDGWIPVEEALPPEPPEYVDDEDDLEEYIVMIDGAKRPTTLRYAGDGTWWEDGTYYPVIAWQPLPESYCPERSGGE